MTEKIKHHKDNRKYLKIQRQVTKDTFEKSSGYIVDFSKAFILLQDVDDFDLNGYSIFPVKTVSNVQFNKNDKYYDKIMRLEGLNKVVCKHQIELKNWTSIFKSIKLSGLNVIVENEDPNNESFDIGSITKVTKASVYIRYFDAQGYLDTESTKISFDLITIVKFDDRYTNTFSKYLRERNYKSKK